MKNLKDRKRFFTALIIILFMTIPSAVSAAPVTDSLINLLPFGGRVTAVTHCSCSNNYLVTIGPPKGGTFIYESALSILHMFRMILKPGAWTLGNATPGGVCRTADDCAPIPATGTIKRVGTSL